MQQKWWTSWLGAVAMATLATGLAGAARADVTSDRPAAILIYPYVVVDSELNAAPGATDTLIQLTNTSNQPVILTCFYENSNGHCLATGAVCDPNDVTTWPQGCGTCIPGWNEIDFRIFLTPLQPIGWLASQGLQSFPLPGNTGSRIPPVPEFPFTGLLKCIVVDETGAPTDANVVKGEATIGYTSIERALDIAKYNAVGIQAIGGAVNADNELVLGGEGAEFNGCPSVLILNHLFDRVEAPVSEERVITRLVLVPCTQNILRQIPGAAVVQYLVFNEFEQRFSTSRPFDCQQTLPLSSIDTTQPDRSIFSAGVTGTVAGQTRLTPIGSGLVGVAIETLQLSDSSAAFNIHFQGERSDADVITIP